MTGQEIRNLVVEVSAARGTGHVGSALSVCEIMAAIFNDFVEARRTLVMSKGHAALAYYAALHLSQVITREELFSYCQDGSRFGVHTEAGQPGVLVSTGSLGMGLSIAVGLADSLDRTVVCLLSDAELDEGSTWEAMALANKLGLRNLIVVLDDNGSQAMGKKRDIMPIPDLFTRVTTMGWGFTSYPGHDQEALETYLQRKREKPEFISANTVIGKGVKTMEGDYRSHYLPLTAGQVVEFRGPK